MEKENFQIVKSTCNFLKSKKLAQKFRVSKIKICLFCKMKTYIIWAKPKYHIFSSLKTFKFEFWKHLNNIVVSNFLILKSYILIFRFENFHFPKMRFFMRSQFRLKLKSCNFHWITSSCFSSNVFLFRFNFSSSMPKPDICF